jgi:hypothetical protein
VTGAKGDEISGADPLSKYESWRVLRALSLSSRAGGKVILETPRDRGACANTLSILSSRLHRQEDDLHQQAAGGIDVEFRGALQDRPDRSSIVHRRSALTRWTWSRESPSGIDEVAPAVE